MEVWTFDNFLGDPLKEREKALAATYETIEHNALKYRGISFTDDPKTVATLETLIECKFTGVRAMYRRYLEGEENETYIHSDVLIGTFTAILFLNLPHQCVGGTAFWRHKKYGLEFHGAQALKDHGIEDTKELCDELYQDGFDESKWEMTEMVPMKFNRMIVFWSPRFHSRYPQVPMGHDLETSRLVKVFFLPVAA